MGNYFSHNDKWNAYGHEGIFQWSDSDWYGLGECTLFLENISPVLLTEEILLKCGFYRLEYNDYRHPVLIGTLTLYEGVAELHISDMYSVWVNNLHQLQNLFYCLCGLELDVNI